MRLTDEQIISITQPYCYYPCRELGVVHEVDRKIADAAYEQGRLDEREELKKKGHLGLWDTKNGKQGFTFTAEGEAALMGNKYAGQRGHLIFIPEE